MMGESKEEGGLEKKTTKIHIVSDGYHGHYGTSYCGNCNETVPEPYCTQDGCKKCGYSFKGIKDCTPPGGSDF